MKDRNYLVAAIVVLLLAVDWLTFHDFFEPHSTRDWLILTATLLVFFYFAKDVKKMFKS